MENWINIKNELPEEFEDVIVTDGSDVWVDNYNLKEDGTIDWTNKFGEEITLWMYLPEPPGGSKEETLFSIIRMNEDKEKQEIRVEILKDLDKLTATGAFIALLQALAEHNGLMDSFSAAVRIFSKNIGLIKEASKKERPLS